MITYKGTWVTQNTFIKSNGESIRVYPYNITLNSISLPMDCFIMLDDESTVREIVPIRDTERLNGK